MYSNGVKFGLNINFRVYESMAPIIELQTIIFTPG